MLPAILAICLVAQLNFSLSSQQYTSKEARNSSSGVTLGESDYSCESTGTSHVIYNNSVSVLKSLFTNYMDTLPRNEAMPGPLHVNIQTRILRLLNVDEMKQVFSFSAKVDIVWKDHRLTWNPEKYGNIRRVEVPQSVAVWTPDVTWHERLEVDFTWRSYGRLELTSNGYLKLSSQVIMFVNCYMDPGYFPFDSHVCTLTFEPIVHTSNEVVLRTQIMEGMHNQSLSHDQWIFSLLRSTCASRTHTYLRGDLREETFVENRCNFFAQRRPLYHIFNLLLPATVITFMTVFSFLIPPTESDVKIQFSLLVMLQLVVFLMYIYNSLPVSASQIPLLSRFFAICLLLVAVSCMMNVISSYLHWVGEDNITVPSTLRRLSIQKLGPVFAKHHCMALDRMKAQVPQARSLFRGSGGSPKASRRGVFGFSAIASPWMQLLKNDAEHTVQNPNADDRVDSTRVTVKAEHEWNINKAEWSLVSLVLDRVCAVIFLLAFFAVVLALSLAGVYNQSWRRR